MSTPPEEPRFPSRPRHYGLGLRAQMLVVLSAAFVLSFSALSIVVVSAAQKAQELERARRAQALAEVLARALPSSAELRERALAELIGRAQIAGAELQGAEGARRFGEARGPALASARLPEGARLRLWLRAREADGAGPLARLLRLYSFVTGGLILVVVYVALTRLIVHPVEKLTNAVERLPGASEEAAISIVGAAEVARLAVSFKRMARELRREKRALEQQLAELEHTTRVLRSTQDRLIRSEKLAGVGRLAAGIAHEIGNPLAAILGLVELLQLQDQGRSAEEHEFLARIRSETERIHRIIRDLLDYARLTPKQEVRAVADLEKVVDEAVALIAPQKDLRRVTLERRVYGSDSRVRGSAHELTQLVLNLLLNAADAVAGDGEILIELGREGGEVKLAISDTGPGIAPELRDKLFDPFVTSKPAGKGTGLGLAVCHAIVERLGGSIGCEDRPRGARFTVRLPAASERAAAGPP